MEKVVISYCHNGMVHQPFMHSLFDLCFYELGRERVKFKILDVSHAYIPQSRNFAVTKFLETDSDWLLFFDYDMTFGEDFLERLLSVADSDHKIVCGLYFYTAAGTDAVSHLSNSMRKYGINKSCLNGKRKSHKGFIFKYVAALQSGPTEAELIEVK